MSRRSQQGYVLFTVVVMLVVVAVLAFLVSYDSSLKAGMPEREAEASRADYVADAAMQHALWYAQNNACMGDVAIPVTTLGADSYSATVTGAAAGTLYTLTADQDAWIRDDDPTRNNGTTASNHIRFEGGNTEHSLTRFDVSGLPAQAQIVSAVAWFNLKDTREHAEGPISIHEITADWAETSVTWDSFADAYSSASIGMIPAQDVGNVWVKINLTGLVQSWVNGRPNYGILMRSSAEGVHGEYWAREDATSPPRLEVVVGSGQASPVTIQATGTLDNGVTPTLSRPIHPAYQPPGTVTLQLGTDPGADTILDSFYLRNYGAQDFVQVTEDTGNWVQRPVFKFELGRVPAGAAVLSAQLELRMRDINTPGTATVHRVTQSWVEGTKYGTGTADGATWGTYDGTNNWTSPGGDFDAAAVAEAAVDSSSTWVSWEIGPLVEQWLAGEPNNGLLLKSDGILEEAEFYSKEEDDATLRPRLTITYACECGSACLSQGGTGNILMVVRNATNMWFYDRQKKAYLESWGYTVNIIDDSASVAEFEAGIAANDVAYISEPVTATEVDTKLTNAVIGVVSDEGRMNDELGMADFSATPVLGREINISDTSHYITSVFPAGPLEIYTDAMEGLTVSGTEAPELQTLADWGGAGSLVLLESGATTVSGGSSPGRRVMLPFGRQVDSNVNWDRLNGNGRLIAQRAIAWAMGADGGSSGKLLMVVGNAASPSIRSEGRRDLFESWGYAVTLIDDGADQLKFDTEAAANDVVYVTDTVSGPTLLDKVTNTTAPVVNEKGSKLGNFGFSSIESGTLTAAAFTGTDALHYITEPFGGNPVTVFGSPLSMAVPSGTLAPDLQNVGQVSATPALGTLDAGATLWNGGSAPAKRVHLPLGAAEISELTPDGLTLMQRSIEWAAGAGAAASPGYDVLLIVGNDTTLTSKDVGYKALMESWGHTVALLNDGASQADYDTAMAAADVIYASGSAVGSSMLDKATYTTKGMVNEVNGKIDNFGFSSSTGATASFDAFSTTNATHYITESFGGNPVTVFTSSLTNPVPGGTLAPDLQNVGQVSATPALGTLDAGAMRYDSTPSQGRRAHLPFTSAETTDMTADGKTILQRAIEWAAGAGAAASPAYDVLLIVGNDTTLASKDVGYKALMESWGHTVALLNDGASQADYDTAMAAADVIYASGSAVGSSMLDKATYTTKGMVNEVNGKIDNFGFSSSTSATANFDAFSTTNATHYITESFVGNPVTVFTSSLTNPVPGGTLAPDLQNVGQVSATPALGTLDAGAMRYDSTPSQGRRAHLPFASAETSDMTAEGKTILQRAIEWAAGSGAGGGGGGGGGPCDGNFRDDFNTLAFNGSNGSLSWASDWIEVGESDGPTSGDTQIMNDESNYQLRTRDNNNGGEGVEREADLSGAASATLNYDYRRMDLDNANDYTSVEVSANGAAGPWTELTRHQGSGNDSSYQPESHNITSFISAFTRIRLKTSSSMGNTDTVWFDNVEIACTP